MFGQGKHRGESGTPPTAAGRLLVSSWRGGIFQFAFYARFAGRGGCFTPRGAC